MSIFSKGKPANKLAAPPPENPSLRHGAAQAKPANNAVVRRPQVPPPFNAVRAAKAANAAPMVQRKAGPSVPPPYKPQQSGNAGQAKGALHGAGLPNPSRLVPARPADGQAPRNARPLQARLNPYPNPGLTNKGWREVPGQGGSIQAKAGALPAKSLPVFSRVIQRMEFDYNCPNCGKAFETERGLNIHIGRWCTGSSPVKDDVMSEWSEDSLDSGDEREVFSTSKKNSKQPKLYNKYKHHLQGQNLEFHSSTGLKEAVDFVGHGGKGQSDSNTHLLASGTDDEGNRVRLMMNLSTLNSMTAYAKRFGAFTVPPASNVFGKKQHIHAEMYLIWLLTNGNEDDVDGCMAGLHLVVDKPICQQCYPWVVRAAPSLVDDGVDFGNGVVGRGDYSDTWKSPFLKKFNSKIDMVKNPFDFL